ncbi:hypothetical protein NPIL_441391 [Nephila pilipes]|uniref:Uncharacterized protein n=1 Tax=Nephila pilipes TaxID=299642 RepID=A0A8X6QPD4_NEPPI|nr:hypothetical protein NPIL_441391 [Nephila pilipes]
MTEWAVLKPAPAVDLLSDYGLVVEHDLLCERCNGGLPHQPTSTPHLHLLQRLTGSWFLTMGLEVGVGVGACGQWRPFRNRF